MGKISLNILYYNAQASLPITKIHPLQNVNSANIEKLLSIYVKECQKNMGKCIRTLNMIKKKQVSNYWTTEL